MGDVSGHGVAPALISAFLKATVSELVRRSAHYGPAELCNDLHTRFLESVDTDSYYATFFMAIFDPEAACWHCMNCGHPDPVLIRDGQVCYPGHFSQGGGVPVGFALAGARPYTREDEVTVAVEEGLYLLLYTDGITEARHAVSKEECGEETLSRIAAGICDDRNVFNKPHALTAALRAAQYNLDSDDSTIICIYTKRQSDIVLDMQIPPDLQQVADVSARLEADLMQRGWEETSAAAVRLLVMEHGANIVEHGRLLPGRGFWMQVTERDECCRIVFTDDGREWDLHGAAHCEIDEESLSERGRGLAIINSIAGFAERYRINNQNVCFYVVRNREPGCDDE
jgi:anti-sigma regulatory factor (Ser/Thr protein kinase)